MNIPRTVLHAANCCALIYVLTAGTTVLPLCSLFAANCFLAYGLFAPWCNWVESALTTFTTNSREVWLTIDDGPDGVRTVALLEALKARGVAATFFVKGAALAVQPEVGRALLEQGHTIANHTHSHPIKRFWLLGPKRLHEELRRCQEEIERVSGRPSPWFRSPLGFKNAFLATALRQHGMRLVLWSIRAHDGVICRPADVVRRVKKRVRPGAIILMHEGRPRSNEAIVAVVDELRASGYRFVIPQPQQLT